MGQQKISVKQAQSDMTTDLDVHASAQQGRERVVGTQGRARGSSGASGNRHRSRVRPSEKRFNKWSEFFIPPVGETRAERVGVSTPVRMHRYRSIRIEQSQPAVVIAPKVRHQADVPIEVV